MMSDEIRIGVFVCDCGTNIAGVVNVPEVVAFARTLNHVALEMRASGPAPWTISNGCRI